MKRAIIAKFGRSLSAVMSVLLLAGMMVSPASAEGAWVGVWDVLLDGNGAVHTPGDLAIDSNQTLYVVDIGYQLVLKKEKNATNWTFLPNQPYSGSNPWLTGVVVDANNNVYVLNRISGNFNVLWKYDGSTWTDIGVGTVFISPVAVAVDQAGNIYVADKVSNADASANQIRKKTSGGTTWSVVGNWNNGQFTNLVALSTDTSNNLYACEAILFSGVQSARLMRLQSGTTTWQAYPDVANQLRMLRVPNDMTVDRFGNLYVTDSVTQELHVFAKNATQWAQIRKDGNVIFNSIFSVAVDQKGYVYVSDPTADLGSPNRRILRHQPWVTQLIWERQPGGAVAYQTLNPSPIARLVGQGGDAITNAGTAAVTASLTVPNGATLGGTKVLNLTNGSADFTDLTVDKPGTYSLSGLAAVYSENIKRAVYNFDVVNLTATSNTFTISPVPQAAAPSANPPSGATVVDGGTITLSSTTPGAYFHYTTDGSTPTTSSPTGSVITLSAGNGNPVIVKAFTRAAQYSDSSVASFTYTVYFLTRLPLIQR